ncbi:hypothetical protein D4R75_01850 [bacterium]|nr:MAG: hypothetical protein D4R75_01850 [bacterium]
MKIGITDTLKPNLAFYTECLKLVEKEIEFTVLSHVQQNAEGVDSVDGLLLTGGGDVDPSCRMDHERPDAVPDACPMAPGENGKRI